MSVKRKPGRPKVNPEKKLCLKCRQAKTLDSFFRNAGWAEQLYHDTWCKPCARGFAKTKETLREYVWNNNREWREAFWLRAVDNALLKLGNNKAYLNANERKQKVLLEEEACNLYLTKMNMAQNYVYSPNVSPEDMNYGGFEDHEERLEREHRAM